MAKNAGFETTQSGFPSLVLEEKEETKRLVARSITFSPSTHESSHSKLKYFRELFSGSSSDEFFIIVKFQIHREVFATKFKIMTTLEKVQERLLDVLELEKESLILLKDGHEVELSNTLADYMGDLSPYSKIVFQISSPNGEKGIAEICAKVEENIPTLDVITVHQHQPGEQEKPKDLVVQIEKNFCSKEWLGGYHNKLTNTDYHNAASQTAPKQRKIFEHSESGEAIPLVLHRDTQTPFKPKDVILDTTANKATQMWRTDLFIQSKTDKIMTARPYTNYDDWCIDKDIVKYVIKIQRRVRKWIRSKKFREIVSGHKAVMEDVKRQKAQIVKEQADKEREIITNAAYPVKRDDFYMLYLMVEKWWKKEWKRICELRSTEPRKADAVMLLNKEVKLLETIEKHRIASKKEALKKERMRFLEQMSRPYIFKSKNGKMVSIDDTKTQRAREFKEIYSALTCRNITPEERVDFLLTLKALFENHFMNFEYANDLISLIQREIDLLTMGTKFEKLIGLHKRIEQLFMNFVEQKEFNIKAEKYKRPNFPKTLATLFLCTRCLKLLPVSKFPVHVRMTSYTECKSCVWLKNISHQRVDMSPYLKLLKYVQNSEMQMCCHSAVCFILQPIGMGYLTNIIWHGHSAISECADISKLQHIRWIKDVEWAPWNTILLTDQEAKCHSSIPDVFQFYDKIFIENVRQKHILARKQFLPLLKIDHEIRTSGAWSTITDSGPFLHPSHNEELAGGFDYDKI